jgi:hypothetical protein
MRGRLGLVWLIVLTVAAIGACSTRSAGPSDPASPTPNPSPKPSPTGRVYTVSEAIAARDAGELGSDQITLTGYWSDRSFGHSCGAPPQPQGELELGCHDGEFGISEANEAIGRLTPAGQWIPAESAHLSPWGTEDIGRRLVTLPLADGVPFPPVPIVVVGHFDDPRAADCRPQARQLCRERFVLDEIVSFDPASVPPPTPTPEPTPFPDPPPPAPFGPEACAGDVEYSFVGWTTTAELGTDAQREGHVFAMVTEEQVPLGDWWDEDLEGPLQPSRWWGQRICFTTDVEAAAFPEGPPILFDHVDGTTFREWQDGRREPGSP